jgi:hypothetical protein
MLFIRAILIKYNDNLFIYSAGQYDGEILTPDTDTYAVFEFLVHQFFSFQVEVGSIPGRQNKARGRVCLSWDKLNTSIKDHIGEIKTSKDPNHRLAMLLSQIKDYADVKAFANRACSDPYVAPATSGNSGANSGSNAPAIAVSNVSGTVNISSATRDPSDASHNFSSAYVISATNAKSKKIGSREAGLEIRIVTRSTWGIYQMLGNLYRLRKQIILKSDLAGDHSLLTVNNEDSNCFVSTSYRNISYCVPNYASITKAEFTILQELFALNTNLPSNPGANTQTARITP